MATMTAEEVRDARAKLGLTQIEMARELGVALRTYRRWEKGLIRQPGALAIRQLVEERG